MQNHSSANLTFCFIQFVTDFKRSSCCRPGAYLGKGGHCAMSPLLTLPFSKKEQTQWCLVFRWFLLLMARGVGRGVCIFPPAIFENVLVNTNFA